MRYKSLQKYVLVFFMLLLVFLVPFSALAQDTEKKYYGVVLEPGIIRETIKAGTSRSIKVNISNDFEHKQQVIYYPLVMFFSGVGELHEPNFPDKTNAAEWVSVNEDKYVLNYAETKQSNIIVDIPSGTQSGGYYAAVVYSEIGGNDNNSLSLNKNIVLWIFITVEGDNNINKTTELVDFHSNKSLFDFSPIDFITTVKNTGNIHTNVQGNIFVYQGSPTNTISSVSVNPQEFVVLPGNTREYTDTFNWGFISTQKEGFPFKFDFSNFPKIMFGEYHALLRLHVYENNVEKVVEKDITFFVVPWELLVLLVLVVFIVIMVSNKKKKRI